MENNKLIAEFMGYEIAMNTRMVLPHFIHAVNLDLFQTSWNYLMPVVEKIESLGYEFFIVEDRIKIAHNTDHSIDTIINFTLGGSKIDATYKGVVEFIKQYNETK